MNTTEALDHAYHVAQVAYTDAEATMFDAYAADRTAAAEEAADEAYEIALAACDAAYYAVLDAR